ncbi:50S ribosomal protein L11 methyltransferase [Terrimonas pollutisoli]|uniref:50S ribosomal protein L11 methyltransferase n=1 Tax=Terrimonas pollutisoli TaxID=3034147 RepID=UPI0023EBBF48|nr:50S ribosomal protein L11 methyltransferase [Terrimonas sp. H1YJ31]
MGQYIQIEFQHISQEQSDILIAQLSQIGFDGFEEGEHVLKAFISSDDYDENLLKTIAASGGLNFSKTIIEETNWNQLWESSFSPVVVGDFVAVRADFHEPIEEVKFEVVITPKMSFGTGHHATTYLMMQQMEQLDFADKNVLDFGTGTGVLAILAGKLGANKIVAIDNDKWSIENAAENIKRNTCSRVDLQLRDSASLQDKFDIILANINKNVILDNLETIARQINPGGTILLSGLLTDDEQDILIQARNFGLKFRQRAERDNWLLLNLSP